MIVAVVIPFLNEEAHLRRALASIARQTRTPDRLMLVDDGSADASFRVAAGFAKKHAFARALQRVEPAIDEDTGWRSHHAGMLNGSPLRALQWGVEHLDVDWDVVAKVDGDIVLPPSTIARMEELFAADPALGIAGPRVGELRKTGAVVRYNSPRRHVEGMTKFYRRRCFEDISPIPPIPGWDTIDEFRARMLGWRTASSDLDDGDAIHLRPKGGHDGVLLGFYRQGMSAYAYGSHPAHVALYGGRIICTEHPLILGGMHYLAGWGLTALRGSPRADARLRAAMRRDQWERVQRRLRRLIGMPPATSVARSP